MDAQIQIRLDQSPAHAAAMLNAAPSPDHARIELAGADTDLLAFDQSQVVAEQITPRIESKTAIVAALFVERFHDGHLAADDFDRRRQAWNHASRIIEWAAEQSVERVSIAPALVAADHPFRVRYQDALNRSTEALDGLARLADQYGVPLSIRANVAGFLTSPPELREWIARLNSPAIGVDLDLRVRGETAPWTDWLLTLEATVDAIGVPFDPTNGNESAGDLLDKLTAMMETIDTAQPYRGAIVLRASGDGG